MKIKSYRYTKVAIAAFLTMISLAVTAQAQAATKLVTNLYKANGIKRVATWSKAELEKYFTGDLAAAIYKAARKGKGIGFDILYNSRGRANITNLKIGDEDTHHESSGETVHTVTAAFKNSGKEVQVFFTINVDEFKIIEITYYGQDESLTDILSANKFNPSPFAAESFANYFRAEKKVANRNRFLSGNRPAEVMIERPPGEGSKLKS